MTFISLLDEEEKKLYFPFIDAEYKKFLETKGDYDKPNNFVTTYRIEKIIQKHFSLTNMETRIVIREWLYEHGDDFAVGVIDGEKLIGWLDVMLS